MGLRYFLAFLIGAFIWLLVLALVARAAEQTPTEILESKRNEFIATMQRLDAQWQLIPYQYKELEEKVRVIDQELEKRGVRKNESPPTANPEKK